MDKDEKIKELISDVQRQIEEVEEYGSSAAAIYLVVAAAKLLATLEGGE